MQTVLFSATGVGPFAPCCLQVAVEDVHQEGALLRQCASPGSKAVERAGGEGGRRLERGPERRVGSLRLRQVAYETRPAGGSMLQCIDPLIH